jgi:hypothetical protein
LRFGGKEHLGVGADRLRSRRCHQERQLASRDRTESDSLRSLRGTGDKIAGGSVPSMGGI